MPCPPSLLPTDNPTLTADVAVVGAGPSGAATAWHLARRGLHVVLLERRAAGRVWRAAGSVPWTDLGLPEQVAAEAARLWRQVEEATGAQLLHVVGGVRQVRADQTTAALTAAATAWGAQLRHCDEVVAIDAADGGALVHTRSATVRTGRVVLAGCGPVPTEPGASVATVPGHGSFALPVLTG